MSEPERDRRSAKLSLRSNAVSRSVAGRVAAPEDNALAMAVRLYRSPIIARNIRRSPLPADIIFVIRVAAGCPTSCASAAIQTGMDEGTVGHIAELYLLVALFGQRADMHRTLGLVAGAPSEQVRDHKKWLLKWLHPDRNHNPWLANLSVRILAASSSILSKPAVVEQAPVQAPPAPASEGPSRRHRQRRFRWMALPLDALDSSDGLEITGRTVAKSGVRPDR